MMKKAAFSSPTPQSKKTKKNPSKRYLALEE